MDKVEELLEELLKGMAVEAFKQGEDWSRSLVEAGDDLHELVDQLVGDDDFRSRVENAVWYEMPSDELEKVWLDLMLVYTQTMRINLRDKVLKVGRILWEKEEGIS